MAANEPRFATVVWLDAWADGVDDVSPDKVAEKHKPIEMTTRGWVLLDDDVGVSLFYERSADGSYRGRTFIPRGMIKDISDFPPKRKPRTKREAKQTLESNDPQN